MPALNWSPRRPWSSWNIAGRERRLIKLEGMLKVREVREVRNERESHTQACKSAVGRRDFMLQYFARSESGKRTALPALVNKIWRDDAAAPSVELDLETVLGPDEL